MAARYALVAILSAAMASAQSWSDEDSSISTSASTSAFWTYTARIQDYYSEELYTYTDYSEVYTDVYTTSRTIKDSVTPTATPTDVSTSTGYYYDDLEIVYEYYPTGAAAESDLVPEYDYYSTATTTTTVTAIEFNMPVTMTAPASCPTPFTVTTSATVTVPSQVTAQISPVSTETGSTITGTGYRRGTVYEYATWYLSANAAPFTSTSDYYYEYYIASCSTPPAPYRTGSTSGDSRSGSGNDDDSSSSSDSSWMCYHYYYCSTPLLTWVIVIATVIPGLFLLGFLESWFWFRRLMIGKSAMRLGTVCWVCISLWVMCFTRMQDRRSKEDQKLLAENWKNMGSGAAFKAWWKWGFRHRYPEELLGQFSKTTVGIVRPGQSLPGMIQTPGSLEGGPSAGHGPVHYYGPPPPGWVQGPNGEFIPPQGYMYPPPAQAGYYGNAPKGGPAISQSQVSAPGSQQPHQQTGNVPAMPPQAPQPVHTARQDDSYTPTPYGAPPNVGPLPTQNPPQIPQVHVSDAPDSQAPGSPSDAPALPPHSNGPTNNNA